MAPLLLLVVVVVVVLFALPICSNMLGNCQFIRYAILVTNVAFEQLKQQVTALFFMEVINLFSWSIWTTRNNFIFNGIQPSTENMKASFIHEFAMVIHMAKQKYFSDTKIWLESVS